MTKHYLIGLEAFSEQSHYIETEYDEYDFEYIKTNGYISVCGKVIAHMQSYLSDCDCDDCIRILRVNARLTK